jgi:serine/threonine protein phosphatase PrpC
MNFEYFSLTDTGMVRDNNEDSVALDGENHIAILADGMGGYNAGEVASAMATTFVRSELGRWMAEGGSQASSREIKRAMEICIDNANRSIFNAANSQPQYAGMGTTLVMGVFQDARTLIGHVGDSRCYRMRAGAFVQLTRDHSLLQEQLDAGLITPEQAQYATHKNLVTRALGVEDTVLLEVNEFRIEDGDLFVLVTAGTLEEKARALIDAANDSGGRDNISVILAAAKSKPVRKGLLSRMLGQ